MHSYCILVVTYDIVFAHFRRATLTEIEEDRLWNGKEYISMPNTDRLGNQYTDAQWKKLGDAAHPYAGFSTIKTYQQAAGEPVPVPYHDAQPPDEMLGTGTYLDNLREQQYDRHQQVEAQNRYSLLEHQTPDHNLTARTHKMDLAVDKTQPKVFYDHEGKYQRERAGLYKTSYDPYNLQYDMNANDIRGSALMDTTSSHLDALDKPPRDLNQEMNHLMRYGRTLGTPGSVPQFHDQPSQFEAIEPYNDARRKQKAALQPQVETTDVKTQENGTTLQESTYGESYSTPKFLQDRGVSRMQRNEPLNLMSESNRNLLPIRLASLPRTARSVQFNEDITVAAGAGLEPIRLSSAPINNPKMEGPYRGRPDSSPQVHTNQTRGDPTATYIPASHGQQRTQVEILDGAPAQFKKLPVPMEKTRYSYSLGHDPIINSHHLDTKSSNLMPTNLRHSWAGGSAYNSQFAVVDMSFKTDDRFNWSAGSGMPRPQSTLLQIQDSFSKSDVRKKFHERFPETNPDLRENILFGKKHEFSGMNAQILRGTPIVA